MIYLLGGVSHFEGPLKTSLQKNLHHAKSIAFLPTSPEEINKTKKYARVTLSWFEAIRLNFEESYVLNNTMTTQQIQTLLSKAAGISRCDLDLCRESTRISKSVKADRDLLIYIAWQLGVATNQQLRRIWEGLLKMAFELRRLITFFILSMCLNAMI